MSTSDLTERIAGPNGLLPACDIGDTGTPLPSPCIGVCRMDECSGWCAGCLRSIDEIIAWGRATEAAKREVWQQLRRRALEFRERDTR